MADSTVDRDTKKSDGKLKAMKMAAVKIPKGVLVCVDASGYATNGSDVAGLTFVGVSYEQVDNSAGTPGEKLIRVEKIGEHTFAYSGGDATQAQTGKECYVVDNQTVEDDPFETDHDVKCGVITEVLSASLIRLRIDGYAH